MSLGSEEGGGGLGGIGAAIGGAFGGPVGAIVGSVGGSLLGADASRDAARTQGRAAREAAALQYQSAQDALNFQLSALDQIRADLLPQRQIGVQAMNVLADLYGFDPVSLDEGSVSDRYQSMRDQQAEQAQAEQDQQQTVSRTPTGISGVGDLIRRGRAQAEQERASRTPNGFSDVGEFIRRGRAHAEQEQQNGDQMWAGGSPGGGQAGWNNSPGTVIDNGTGQVVTPMPKPTAVDPLAPPEQALPDDATRRQSAMDRIMNDPGVDFRMNRANAALENSAAARGQLFGTGTAVNMAELNQNMASQEFGNAFNRLATLAGFGSAATSQGVGATQGAANAAAPIIMGAGNARASGITGAADARAAGQLGQANAISGGLNNLSNMFMFYQMMNG